MKPCQFDYHAPNTLDEAVNILNNNDGAVILAGGQSLVPAMNFRLANPSHIVDIKGIEGLSEIKIDEIGCMVGALVTHRNFEINSEVLKKNPLISSAMRYVAHLPIRNHGTVVGSLCHADAAAEMPLILLMLGGKLIAKNINGTREINADSFFQFHMTTSKQENEIITHAFFPHLPENAGFSFSEFARRHGDYAIAGACSIIEVDDKMIIIKSKLGGCGINNKPVRLEKAENLLLGNKLDEHLLNKAVNESLEYVIAGDDMHATLSYRKHLFTGLLRNVISDAYSKASKKVT